MPPHKVGRVLAQSWRKRGYLLYDLPMSMRIRTIIPITTIVGKEQPDPPEPPPEPPELVLLKA